MKKTELDKMKFPSSDEYKVSYIPKNSGGKRKIEAPSDELKARQRAALLELDQYLYQSVFAHGFTHNKNIVTMAMGHVKKDYVMAFDIENFFPSITVSKIAEELYKNINYRGRCKTVLKNRGKTTKEMKEMLPGLLEIHFTEFPEDKEPRLPQGASCSPMLSNVFMHNFDWFAAKKALELGVNYSRYADDFVISGEDVDAMWRLYYHCLQPYINKIGLTINKKKTKCMSAKHRQRVCGIIVNEKINLPRRWRKNFRAELHQQGTSLKDVVADPKKACKLRKDTRGRLALWHMVYTKTYKNILNSCDFLNCQKVLSVGGK